MNRFAQLVEQLQSTDSNSMKRRMLRDYLRESAQPDASAAIKFLSHPKKWRRLSKARLFQMLGENLDEVLYRLSLEHVGDKAETLALLWQARPGANSPPSPHDMAENLGTLGQAELLTRVKFWFDACEPSARLVIVSLLSGSFRSPLAPEHIEACVEATTSQSALSRRTGTNPVQQLLFADDADAHSPGTVRAALLYVERGSRPTAPLRCTFALLAADGLVPITDIRVPQTDAHKSTITEYAAKYAIQRFGPVQQMSTEPEAALVASIAYQALERAPRRRSGFRLVDPAITKLELEASTRTVSALAALQTLFPKTHKTQKG